MLIFTGILFIGWISAGIDDGLNPWIRKTEMNWTSFFTTRHYNTWLYIKDAQAWLILNTFFFLPISISLAALFVNPLLSLGLTVLSLLSSFIVLVVIHRYS